jgi:hypothetical protein
MIEQQGVVMSTPSTVDDCMAKECLAFVDMPQAVMGIMVSSALPPDRVLAAAEQLGVDPGPYAAHIKLLAHDEAEREVSRAMTTDKPQYVDRDIVHGEQVGYLVFIPEARAKDLAEVVNAWWNAPTWGNSGVAWKRAASLTSSLCLSAIRMITHLTTNR